VAGRRFTDWEHLNHEAQLWCDRLNAKFSQKLHASRRELFAAEQPYAFNSARGNPVPRVIEHREITHLRGASILSIPVWLFFVL
jgi:hypothetical protein